MGERISLGVNIDHVATLRQARREHVPDLVAAAKEVISAGADGIVVHLREDRRHIQDNDVRALRKLGTRLDLEMAMTGEIQRIALDVSPDLVTLVPEKRHELTTEGGLDVVRFEKEIRSFIAPLREKGIIVSLFVDPKKDQIEASAKTDADFVEIHTGAYACAKDVQERKDRLNEIKKMAELAAELELGVNAGHGLDYNNVADVARIECLEELNIGFSIIARAIFVGLKQATKEMISILK